jgi:hypothetical protein
MNTVGKTMDFPSHPQTTHFFFGEKTLILQAPLDDRCEPCNSASGSLLRRQYEGKYHIKIFLVLSAISS